MFRAFVIGLLTALVILYQKTEIPEWKGALLWFFFAFSLHAGYLRLSRQLNALIKLRLRWLVAFVWGIMAASIIVQVHLDLAPQISDEFLNQKVLLEGTVIDLPQQGKGRFEKPTLTILMRVNRMTTSQRKEHWDGLKPVVRLKWYGNAQTFHRHFVKEGQKWRFEAKLKRPHASLNPGGFDYERYLFANSVSATGYIGLKYKAQRLDSRVTLRQKLHDQLNTWYGDSETTALVQALVVGDKSGLSNEQWSLLKNTGTLHLMVISGLHIGIMAGLGFWLFARLWNGIVRYFSWSILHTYPRKLFASWGALMFATAYMTLAGFSIPTFRAWLMVLAMVLIVVFRRAFNPWVALALAAFMITVIQPSSILSDGFWLSFLAVALIFMILSQPSVKNQTAWKQAIYIQVWLTLGMIPLLSWLFMQIPVYSVLANLVAVPFVSIIALPFLLFTVLVGYVLPFTVDSLVSINQSLFNALTSFLKWVLTLPMPSWQTGKIGLMSVMVVYVLLFALMFWKTTRLHIKGVFALVLILSFLVWPRSQTIRVGEFEMMVLDVGQGEAIVINTAHHTLVYDTGAKWSDRLDGTALAISPYLKTKGITHIDTLVISHSDNDHAGGVERLIHSYPVNTALSGQSERLNAFVKKPFFQPCYAGQSWQYDDVSFYVVSPKQAQRKGLSDNDASCVLKISTGNQSVLITGDATAKIEKKLDFSNKKLDAQVLIAGHHGSRTSTSQGLLDKVHPKWVVISAGYGNRFGFPHKDVIVRIEKSGAKWLNTACSGGVLLKIMPDKTQVLSQTRKEVGRWYHHACPS